MKNLLHKHPHEDVRAAMVRLLDALTTWERFAMTKAEELFDNLFNTR